MTTVISSHSKYTWRKGDFRKKTILCRGKCLLFVLWPLDICRLWIYFQFFFQFIHILAFLDGPISKGDEKPRSLHPDYIKLYLVMLHHFVIIFILALALIFSRLPCVRPLGLRLHPTTPPAPPSLGRNLWTKTATVWRSASCVNIFFFLIFFFRNYDERPGESERQVCFFLHLFLEFCCFWLFFPSTIGGRPTTLQFDWEIINCAILYLECKLWAAKYKRFYSLVWRIMIYSPALDPTHGRHLIFRDPRSLPATRDPGVRSPTWCLFTHKSVTANNSENCWHANSNEPC